MDEVTTVLGLVIMLIVITLQNYIHQKTLEEMQKEIAWLKKRLS